ncbi:MAG: TIGR04452 family lipoprotein [Leptospiraceae bacterium]|nr:TIGR04452 family lipoprotein [Leptospiraceae bacterium]
MQNFQLSSFITIFILIFTSCMHLPSDKKNTLKGSEVIGRLQAEAKAIDTIYFSTNAKDSLQFKSAHYAQPAAVVDLLVPIVIKINPKLNYQKDTVNECIQNIRTLGLPLSGVASIITCDIKEAAFIDLGPVNTGGRSVEKNTRLLQILSLP